MLLIAAFAVWILFIRGGDGRPEALQAAFARTSAADLGRSEPFRWSRARDREFLLRGRDGLAHPLYSLTRGGVERTASVMDRLTPFFERAGGRAGVDPGTLAAVVFVESGGRADLTEQPDSAKGRAGAAGLTPDVARRDLGLHVDLGQSSVLTKRIAKLTTLQGKAKDKAAAAKFDPELIELRARRRKVDERFEVTKAIDAGAQLLRKGQDALGREDLAVAAYRLGIPAVKHLAAGYGKKATYPQIYFESRPGGNLSTYPFLVEAGRQVLDLYQSDPAELYRLATLHGTKAGAEDVLRPPGSPPSYESHNAIADAYDHGELVALPDDPARLGFEISSDPDAKRVFGNELHRGLRPAALATLIYIAGATRNLAGHDVTLELAGAVKPENQKQMQASAIGSVGSAVANAAFVLPRKYVRPPESTGYSFELARGLPAKDQRSLDAVLERLQALDVIDVVRDGAADRVTVGDRAAPLLQEVR
ncbi:MAG: hypothetical protein QOG62_1767 [Thermoleophilaceae bacterium]|nr:hypothetical protein [Thermoleophilaceae bacterium]